MDTFLNIFTTSVVLPLFIASQVIGLIAFFVAIAGSLSKDRTKTFLYFGITHIFISISTAMLMNWVFSVISFISALRNFSFYFIEKQTTKKCKILPRWVYVVVAVVFIALTIIPTIFIWQWWVDWAIATTKILTIAISLTQSIVLLRAPFIIVNSFTVLNHMKFFNIVGLIQAISFIVVYTVFLIRYSKKSERKKLNEARTLICPTLN